MSRTHWGFRESPFRGTLDYRNFFPSPTHEEALARLEYLVDERRRVGLLFGPTGCGKSMVLDVFGYRARRAGQQVASVNLLGIDVQEFLWLLAAELGVNPDRRAAPFILWRALQDRLIESRYQQTSTVMLLDDADEASPAVLEHLVRLAQFDPGASSRLTIVLAATLQNLHRIPARVLELADLRIDLDPWEPGDTVQFVSTALEQAGRTQSVFSEEALYRLHDLCGGVPRRVTQLANLALMAGAGRGLAQIDVDTVESAYHELGVIEAVA